MSNSMHAVHIIRVQANTPISAVSVGTSRLAAPQSAQFGLKSEDSNYSKLPLLVQLFTAAAVGFYHQITT